MTKAQFQMCFMIFHILLMVLALYSYKCKFSSDERTKLRWSGFSDGSIYIKCLHFHILNILIWFLPIRTNDGTKIKTKCNETITNNKYTITHLSSRDGEEMLAYLNRTWNKKLPFWRFSEWIVTSVKSIVNIKNIIYILRFLEFLYLANYSPPAIWKITLCRMDMTQLQVGKLLLTQVKITCPGINFIKLGGLPVVLILGPWIANLLTHIVQP